MSEPSLTAPTQYKQRVQAEVRGSIVGPRYERYSGIYFFLSLDLVNSTAYKERNQDWQFRIRMFYDEAKNFWTNQNVITNPHIWKYAGDEVLFYKKIRSIRDCEVALRESYQALRRVSETVQTWTEQNTPRLYVKGVCWAQVVYRPPAPDGDFPGDNVPRNIVFESPMDLGGGAPVLDFLGPEIDTGFRLSVGSIKKSLVVSAELAHLVRTFGDRNTGDGLRIVAFRELKGVWEGRRYPILWYRDDWSPGELDRDYDYDDEYIHEVLARAREAKPQQVDRLDAILSQVKRRWLSDEKLPKEAAADLEAAEAADALPATEVHCVAVCFRGDGKVLLALRRGTKATFAGMWEAGCARLQPGEDFYSALKRDYKSDFNLDLDVDAFRPWGVVGSYEFTKAGHAVPGVVFVASVPKPESLRAAKHEKADWFDPNELPVEVREKCVPDLAERVKRAHAIWRSSQAS